MERRKTKTVKAGSVCIGGDSPVSVQSMLSVPAHDIEGNIRQAKALEQAGCQIIRAAVPDMEAVSLIECLKKEI
ncbi:MAG: flavodoxin-dependent (E)-4-hydroxy-3-methylbut-2-enyl-diphosphate synthase, partial [Clostridia bacterium]|nr:flavodoxin-dependent (E)-4-hydroxy-3-methylbut-2-enyl-diphosphate synthase [Clostridia bacterium]